MEGIAVIADLFRNKEADKIFRDYRELEEENRELKELLKEKEALKEENRRLKEEHDEAE